MRRIVAFVSVVTVATAAGWYLSVRGAGNQTTVSGVQAVNIPMPEIAGTTLDGDALSTADLRGDVMVVNVWATWCLPCRREQPELQRLSETYSARGVKFVGINYMDDDAKARSQVARFGVGYPSISDRSGRSDHELGFPGLPATYVVDRSGRIRFSILGETTSSQVAGLLDDLLGLGLTPVSREGRQRRRSPPRRPRTRRPDTRWST